MRTRSSLASALALLGLCASCDDGRYLVGILGGQGQTRAGGTAGTGAGMGGVGGVAGMSPPGMSPPGTGDPGSVGGSAGSMGNSPPQAQLCSNPGQPQPVRPIGIASAQLAERLAALIFNERPDRALLDRTALLRDSVQVQTLARELYRSRGDTWNGVQALADRWLRLSEIYPQRELDRLALGSAAVRAQVTPQLRASMEQETRSFLNHVFQSDGLLRTLLTAPLFFGDQNIAQIYGLGAMLPTPSGPTMLDPNQRSGLLTHPGLLFAKPRAATRGKWIREALLCQDIPPPPVLPPNDDLDVPKPMLTSRQRQEMSTTSQPFCSSCHNLTDGPGFAFEHYDPLGGWRETENGVPVQAGGHLTGLPSGGGAMFGGAPDLGRKLAELCDVQICAVQSFLQHALGGPERLSDERSTQEVWRVFAGSGFDLRELLIAVTGSEVFLTP